MFLYNILVEPLIYLLNIIINICDDILILNPLLAIFFISFIVNFLSYPVFAKIEELCKKDNDIYQKLQPRIDSIKRNFKGQERRMILATYLRQNKYHPLLAHFKQSLIIFLQVPIFVACYIVVCENPLFQSPVLEQINEFIKSSIIPIRTLPILMTLINIGSILTYIKNKPLSAKIYAYTLPVIFLILLYFSPASIVMYWIFNNTFSLMRNIYFYHKNKFYLCLFTYISTVIALAFVVNNNIKTLYCLIFMGLIFAAYKLVLYTTKDLLYTAAGFIFIGIYFLMYKLRIIVPQNIDLCWMNFLLIFEISNILYFCIVKKLKVSIKNLLLLLLPMLIIFTLYIPLKLINSDPREFYTVIDLKDLTYYVFETGLGFFIVYPLMIYYILKQYRAVVYWAVCVVFITFLFSLNTFEQPADVINAYMDFAITETIEPYKNLILEFGIIIFVISLIALLIYFGYMKYINLIMTSVLIVYMFLTFGEINHLNKNIKYFSNQTSQSIELTLSKNKKNVMVLFIDRAISGFFPLIMQEKPHLKSVYTGFVYYPYNVSLAVQTLYSTPSLLGGYEYTPQKLQQDTSKKMVDKHNEAISVMPELFRLNNYDVTLVDMPDVNYEDRSKKRFFNDQIHLYNTEGMYITRNKNLAKNIKHNFIWFLLLRVSPSIYRNFIYNNGLYMSSKGNNLLSTAYAVSEYKKFENLIDNLKIKPNAKGSFSIFVSVLPHQPTPLDKNYQFTDGKNGYNYKENKSDEYINHYNVNMLTYLEIEKLIKKLKENNVYDNTRIIIMSDHGWKIHDMDKVELLIAKNNSILLYKDFNTQGEYKTDTHFMTGADIPYLAADNAVENSVNPFTGKELLPDKDNGVDIIPTYLKKWSPLHYTDKDRLYLYDEDFEYMHMDGEKIKEFIKIEENK